MSEITERSGSMRRQSSFTKSVSSLFKKKKKSSAGDASKEVSSRAETPQATPRGEERAAAPANTSAAAPAPEPAVEPAYASNYAADKPEAAAPAAPEPAAEPTPAPDPTPEPAAPEPAAPEPAAPEPAAPEPEPPAPEPPAPEPPATAAPEPVPEPTTDPEPAASEPVAPEPEPPAPAEETVPAPPALSEEQASGAPTSAEGEAQTPLEPGWEEVQADDGRVYYWKEETDETTWTKPSSRRGSAVEAAAAAYTAAAAGAKEGSEGGDTGRERKPSVHDRMSQFERGCDNSEAATAASGAKRQSGTESVVKQLQKAGIQDDPKAVPASTAPSQHKLALASFERKAEKLAGGGPGHGGGSGSQMSDALKGLQAAREKPDGPSQHSVAMDRLKRQAEQPSVVRRAEPTPETDGTEGAGGMAAAKAALFQKKQEADGPKMSMKEEAMRKLNGKGVVKTSEAFHTKSARGTQHNAALSAFQGMQGVDVTTGGPKKSELRRNTAPPRPNNKAAGIGADGGPSQRAAAMAAFQNVAGGDVAASK